MHPKRLNTIIVGALALAVGLALGTPSAEAGGGFCHGAMAREGNDGTVALEGYCFSPIVMRIETHSTVHFQNHDPLPHLVTGVANSWGSIDQTLAPNTSKDVSFDAPGLYPYTCLLHPGMTGVIVVGDGAFAGNSVAPAVKAADTSVLSNKASAPAGEFATAASPASERGSRWLYAGMGALGGLAVAALGFGMAAAKRQSQP